jgi:hypothetical protein
MRIAREIRFDAKVRVEIEAQVPAERRAVVNGTRIQQAVETGG